MSGGPGTVRAAMAVGELGIVRGDPTRRGPGQRALCIRRPSRDSVREETLAGAPISGWPVWPRSSLLQWLAKSLAKSVF